MKTSIQIEEDKSKKFELLHNKQDKDFVALTLDNVARVEAMIRMDSNYTLSGNVKAEPSKHNNGTLYNGSTAYWMTLLKRIVDGESNIEGKVVKDGKIVQRTMGWNDICIEAIAAVDRENSTHLNIANGREVFLQNLTKVYLSGNLIPLLKCQQYKTKEFVINLLNPSVFVNVNTNIRKYSYNRSSYSFTTKFCHYFCYYIFEGLPEQDNFSIYDDILGTSLVAYTKKYGVVKEDNKAYEKNDFKSYATYSKVIDDIRQRAAAETGYLISRNGFDHLLWYYHKGHPIQINSK